MTFPIPSLYTLGMSKSAGSHPFERRSGRRPLQVRARCGWLPDGFDESVPWVGGYRPSGPASTLPWGDASGGWLRDSSDGAGSSPALAGPRIFPLDTSCDIRADHGDNRIAQLYPATGAADVHEDRADAEGFAPRRSVGARLLSITTKGRGSPARDVMVRLQRTDLNPGSTGGLKAAAKAREDRSETRALSAVEPEVTRAAGDGGRSLLSNADKAKVPGRPASGNGRPSPRTPPLIPCPGPLRRLVTHVSQARAGARSARSALIPPPASTPKVPRAASAACKYGVGGGAMRVER